MGWPWRSRDAGHEGVAPGNEVEGAGQDGDRTGHEGEPPSYEVEGGDY